MCVVENINYYQELRCSDMMLIQIVMMDFLLNHDMDAFKTVLDQVQREAEPDIVALDKVAAHSVNAFTWCSEAFSNRLEMRVVGPECETPHSALFVQALEIFVKFAEV
ncbi:hypothetical protein QYM36_005547 [Artemia franciscana]|uniref:Uncharacterized protein n=1 Tax=Artemia franciscana TaxID=6661 RepID=A0AA88LE72_ARTSF|nr:hypothetical protein QYM36_005547 [Artemia franciscana]